MVVHDNLCDKVTHALCATHCIFLRIVQIPQDIASVSTVVCSRHCTLLEEDMQNNKLK
jgi:hypothetical protein